MKKRIIPFLVLIIIIIINCSLQAQLVFEQISTDNNNIERYSLNGSYYYSFGPSGHLYAGFQDDEPNDQNMFRMRYSWNLSSIPSNATIQSAELTLQGTYTSNYPSNYTQTWVYVRKYETNFTDYSASSWDYMTTAQTLSSQNIPRTITNFNFTKSFSTGDDFCNYVKGKFGGNLYLGIIADESLFSGHSTNVLDFYHGQVKIKIIYTVPATNVTFIADNNFTDAGNTNHGTMVIDGQTQTIPPAGYSITRLTGTNLQLGAISPQNDNQNHQMIWHTGATAPSNWTRDGVYRNPNQNYSFPVSTDDGGKRYVANLRKNYLINQINQTEFDGNQTSQSYIVEQNSGQISTQGNGYTPGTIPYNFVYWTDNLSNTTTRTITPPDNSIYTALYKAPHKSNSTSAYSNTSQRRFIQTPDGVKHICYESMNRVWLEHSTDNGATWFLGNGGKPLSSADSKNPSMSFYGNQLGIVWQENNGGTFKIKMAVFWMSDYSSSLFSSIAEDANNYSHNASPVVEWGYNGKVVVVWSGNDLCANPFGGTALKYWYGSATSNGISLIGQCGIYGTDENSINPTITADYTVSSNPFYFHFAWQQYVNVSTSKIYYSKLYYNQGYLANTTIEEASLNSGYSYNLTPVIVLRKTGSLEYIYVTWLGNRTSPTSETRVLLKYKLGSNWSVTGVYGTSPVQNFSINKGTTLISNQEPLALCWSEPNGASFYNKVMKSPGSGIKTLTTTGKDIRINNGTDFSSMFVNSFSSVLQPYSFSFSQNLGSLGKVNSIFDGREGIVGKNGAQFFFALGDITVDGQNIKFVSIPDSVSIASLSFLNTYFESEPFTVSSTSNLTYGVQYGITDSVLCSSVLNSDQYISFKVELLDAITNKVLDVFDEVSYTGKNIYQYNNLGYKVNLSGIGEKSVKLRLVTDTNRELSFGLSNRFADQSMLAKAGFQTINYKGDAVVTEYALEQNYPNPFNPGTTILYQLPKDGFVTLKIYDILGNEVVTLVDEFREAGKYEVNFNANSLASGVYIYRIAVHSDKLQAGDPSAGSGQVFVSSKKMILLK